MEENLKYRDMAILTRDLKAGEEAAFDFLFRTRYKNLCRFAAAFVVHFDVAEDIVQEVFLSFWKMERESFPNLKTIKTFLYNSVQNRCLNYLRNLEIRDRNYRNLNREELDEDYFLCQQIRAEIIAELFGAIDELPEKSKEIFKKS